MEKVWGNFPVQFRKMLTRNVEDPSERQLSTCALYISRNPNKRGTLHLHVLGIPEAFMWEVKSL